jgi:hypothetical protein
MSFYPFSSFCPPADAGTPFVSESYAESAGVTQEDFPRFAATSSSI